jgi:hypothetical protein
MKYQIILDGSMDADLTRLFGAARELVGQGAGVLLNTHGVLSGANLLAQGGDTTSSGGTTTTNGGTSDCVGKACPQGTIPPHDPYIVVFGAGAAVGLIVGLVVGVMVGKSQSRTSG